MGRAARLELEPTASAHDLALATFQSDQSLGVMMRGMESRGLVSRSVAHGRRFEHRLTDEGRRLLETGHAFAAEIFAESFGTLTAEQRTQLLVLLQSVGDGEAGVTDGREWRGPIRRRG